MNPELDIYWNRLQDFIVQLANVPGELNDMMGAEAVNMQLVDNHSDESK